MRNRYLFYAVTALLALVFAGCTRNPEAAKRKYLESGMKYMDQKKYDSATIEFRKALQIDPRFAEAHFQLGIAELDQGHNREGYKEISQAADLDPNLLKARLAVAGMMLASGPKYYGPAEEHVRYVVEHDPNNAEAYVLLGNILFKEKKPQDAIDAYTKAISVKPDDSNAYLNRGVAYAALSQDTQAEQDLHRAVSLDTHNLQAYTDLASYYLSKHDTKQAEDTLRTAIQNNPDSPMPYMQLTGLLLREDRKLESEQVIQQLRNKQPTSPDVALAIGDYYLASRNPDAAAREYQRGLNNNPRNPELEVRLLETLLSTGKIDEATKMTDQMLKENPGDVTARVTHARILAIQGKSTEAITTLRDVIKDAPENIQAHYILGQVLRQTGDLAGAKSELTEALKQQVLSRRPESPLVLQALAETYRDSRDFDTAREYASRFQKLNENNPAAHFLNATIDIGTKEYEAALTELKEAQKASPNDGLIPLNMAFAYAGLKKYADAEREFQTALKMYPQFDTALADYVAMMFATNQPAKAVALASQYAAANPSRPAAHFIYASALATDKKYDQSIQEYQKNLQLDPKSYMSYVHIGQIYEIQGHPDQALAQYQKALELQPTSSLVNNRIGTLYLNKGDLKSAGKYFQTAVNQNAHDPVSANNLAWVYAVQGENLDMALSLATQAKQIAPDMEAINDTLAWIQYKKGNYQVSVSLAEDAVKKQPQNADFRYHLGMALSGAGDRDRAKTELQKALQLNLKGSDAQDAQKMLASLQ